jgi:phosphatidate cytidylyltransferase
VTDGWAAGLGPRILPSIVLAAGALLVLSAGQTVFGILIAAGAAILGWEWTRLCGGGRFGWTGILQAGAVVTVVAAAALGWPQIGIALILAGIAAGYLTARGSGRDHPRWIAAGIAYIGLPCIALVWLRDQPAGQAIVLWLFLVVWATDIGAFFAGRLIGGPKLAPRISPNKTWAGLLGGAVSAAAVSAALPSLLASAPPPHLLAGAGACLAVVSQGGDLGESWIKRRFGVKDASDLIPGHGGLFDRVDGLLAAALGLAIWQALTGGMSLAWK